MSCQLEKLHEVGGKGEYRQDGSKGKEHQKIHPKLRLLLGVGIVEMPTTIDTSVRSCLNVIFATRGGTYKEIVI